jgi:anti-anti-sigma factor
MSEDQSTSPDEDRGRSTAPGPARELAQVEFHDHDGVTVAAIIGEVDVSNAAEIASAFEDLSGVWPGMVVDLRQLDYLDSSGVSLLHDLSVRLRQRWRRIVVVSPASSPPRRVLELTALDSHTLILDELEPAIDVLRGLG